MKNCLACMVVYINAVDVESLTGPAAVERAVRVTMETLKSVGLTTTLAHFKLSSQGITITDQKHRYPGQCIPVLSQILSQLSQSNLYLILVIGHVRQTTF